MNKYGVFQWCLIVSTFMVLLSSCSGVDYILMADKESAHLEMTSYDNQSEITAESMYRPVPETEGERMSFTEEEAICASTHIVIAKLIRTEDRYLFHVEQILKANSEIDDEIHVTLYPHTNGNEPVPGCTYLLYLEKNIAVFYDYDIYGLFMECQKVESPSKADEAQKKVSMLADRNTAPQYRGNHFTKSTDLNDILKESYHIVTVRVTDDGISSDLFPTVCCSCIITDVVKGDLKIDDSIRVTFFSENEVQVGQEYMVFLAECKESAPIYTLSSRNSVYTQEEGNKILKDYNVIQ